VIRAGQDTARAVRAPDRPADEPASPPDDVDFAPLATSVSVVLFGTLAWLGSLWLVVGVVYAGALAAISIWGSLDSSLWSEAVAGWQRWPVAAAGFAAVSSFVPMLLTNGVTRRRTSHAITVGGALLALIGAVFVVVGFGVESIVFDSNGWAHRVDSIDNFDDLGLARVGLSFLVVLLAYFVAGWFTALAYRRWGWFAVLAVPFAAIPVVVCEFALMLDGPGTQFDVLDDSMSSSSSSLWLGTVVTAAVLAVAYSVAIRWTGEVTIDP
jgi:hypothetical protein